MESYGEHGGESGQLLLSTGNVNYVVKIQASIKEDSDGCGQHEHDLASFVLSRTKSWADQVEEDKEDYVDDSEEHQDEGDNLISSSSPKAPNNNTASTSTKKKLSLLAPVFVPSSKAMISVHDRELFDALESPKS